MRFPPVFRFLRMPAVGSQKNVRIAVQEVLLNRLFRSGVKADRRGHHDDYAGSKNCDRREADCILLHSIQQIGHCNHVLSTIVESFVFA